MATLYVWGMRAVRRRWEAGAMAPDSCFNETWQTSHDRTTHTVTRTRGERPLYCGGAELEEKDVAGGRAEVWADEGWSK